MNASCADAPFRPSKVVDASFCLTHALVVKLNDAIKQAEKAVKGMKGTDAAAIHALIVVGKRVRKLQRPIRQLADTFAPGAPELNQVPLFEEDGPPT